MDLCYVFIVIVGSGGIVVMLRVRKWERFRFYEEIDVCERKVGGVECRSF